MRKEIVIGSRGSRLAMIQANLVVAQIRQVNPDIKISISQIITKGDYNHHTQLNHIEGVGIFVKELDEALLENRIDLAVHSLKDIPTQIPSGLRLTAVTKRLDPRDVLVPRGEKLAEMAPGSKIGTGSLRRTIQLTAYRPDLEVCTIRGNVDTRLRRVEEGEFTGLILAAAGLKRLGWAEKISEYLPLEHFLPAAGQGALAIELRSDDKEVMEIVSALNHLPTWQSITAERAFLYSLGGGCRAPIAALGRVNGTTLNLEGMVADGSGGKIIHTSIEGSVTSPEEVGVRLARNVLKMGAAEFL